MSDESDRNARAGRRRQTMVVRKARLDSADDVVPVSGADGVSLVHRLTRESWSLAGLEIPGYSRREIPVRFVAEPRT